YEGGATCGTLRTNGNQETSEAGMPLHEETKQGEGHRGRLVEGRPVFGWLKQLQSDGIGLVGKGFAINDVCAGIETTVNRSNGDILIGRPGSLRQNAGAVKANVDGRGNLMGGILNAIE